MIPALNQACLHLIHTRRKCFRGGCSKQTLEHCVLLVVLQAFDKHGPARATKEGNHSIRKQKWFESGKSDRISRSSHRRLLLPSRESVTLKVRSSSAASREWKYPQTLFKNRKNILRTQVQMFLLLIQAQSFLTDGAIPTAVKYYGAARGTAEPRRLDTRAPHPPPGAHPRRRGEAFVLFAKPA